MKKTAVMFAFPALLAFGCGDNGGNNNPGADGPAPTVDSGGTVGNTDGFTAGTDAGNPNVPTMPAVGTQLDRMGRGTINVAVTNPFDLTAIDTGPNSALNRDQTRNKYNQDSDPAAWVTNWRDKIAATLAIFDAADTVCGNQLLACGMAAGCPAGTAAMANRYSTLATVLADDRLYLDTSKTIDQCQLYLGVEAASVGVPVTDCGGRLPTQDVVSEMYTAATVGVSGFPNGGSNQSFAITDGVTADGDTGAVNIRAFPFLPAPNP